MPEFLNAVEFLKGFLLKTDQLTQYSSELDDGYYKKGISKAYSILTLGQYADTKNIDLAHLTSTKIAFTSGNPDTITSTTVNFTTLFVAGDVIVISGAANAGNNTNRTIAAGGVAAGTLTLTSVSQQTAEAEGASVTIAKREAHSNNCVLDLNTGLMWSRYVADKMGTASGGKMPWTGQLYDIFAYAAAANVALLGGYSDWRIPNDIALANLRKMEAPNATPNATAFPSWPASDYVWSSTTRPSGTADAMLVIFSNGNMNINVKSAVYFASLVRG